MLFYTNKSRSSNKILEGMKIDKRILDKNKDLANYGVSFLKQGNIKGIGGLLHKYWELKKINGKL